MVNKEFVSLHNDLTTLYSYKAKAALNSFMKTVTNVVDF